MSITHPTRRQLIAATSAAAVLGFGICGAAHSASPASPLRLRLIGETRLPHRLRFKNTSVGGLSGIDFDAATGTYYLISDDGGGISAPRFYTAQIAVGADRLGNVELTGVTFLQGLHAPDPEAIRWHAPSQSLLWTSEGNAVRGVAPGLQQMRPDGSLVRSSALPGMFDFGLLQGSRINKTLEGLAVSPDSRTAWVAMESPLLQDGPVSTVQDAGGSCRFTLIDLTSNHLSTALRQIAYQPDAIPRAPMPSSANGDNGVVEILMLDAHRMLVLERAYMAGLGDRQRNSLRLYAIDTRLATDTLNIAALTSSNHQPVVKTLVADFASFPALARLDNTEGMCWGPMLPGGSRTLLFVSDDNFNPLQITQLLAFEFLQ